MTTSTSNINCINSLFHTLLHVLSGIWINCTESYRNIEKYVELYEFFFICDLSSSVYLTTSDYIKIKWPQTLHYIKIQCGTYECTHFEASYNNNNNITYYYYYYDSLYLLTRGTVEQWRDCGEQLQGTGSIISASVWSTQGRTPHQDTE